MPQSPHFARIRAQVLQLVAAIPEGKVCTFRSIGEYLDVVPRHVAYILSMLPHDEKWAFPWHRVVGADGELGAVKRNPDGTSQAELLRSEGIRVSGDRVESPLESVMVAAEDLPSGLARQKRPPDTPVARRQRTRLVRKP